ncbi:uncharacterized protein LOC129600853 isoform X3 [Paramacrobiotus metropolitanus]|uniref:uncharacterized protein LOC129600853 isoform X3 n=1 Tax=Paramacrobiotus metropolitanus TaxID=2943436 RepID=UPI00244617F7|nr:uncharacterized protein LOC129600853 isoform X3 [Paramacrobiotus metropolitanus]
MTVDWKLVLLATFVFATNKIGKAIECYQCQYASGNFPEDYNRSRTNCLNTITKNCSMTNNCAHRTVLHTTPTGTGNPNAVNVTGAQKTSSAAVSKLNLMWALVFCLIHYGTKIKIQHFPSAVRESIGWW